FRGSITQRLIWLSTLRRGGLPPTTQDSLPAAGPALPDGVGYPQGFDERFHIYDSPFPSFLARGQTLFLVSKTARKSRVGKGRPAGSSELRVSPSPSKIPYGGFSPVRLQMDRQWRPSTRSQGLSAVHMRPMTPSYTPPQFSLPGIRDPRRDYPF